jgi:hypothetical protein
VHADRAEAAGEALERVQLRPLLEHLVAFGGQCRAEVAQARVGEHDGGCAGGALHAARVGREAPALRNLGWEGQEEARGRVEGRGGG